MAHVSLAGPPDLPNSQRVRAHCPELLDGLNAFYERIWLSDRVDASTKELIRMRCATVNQCSY
jgi:hypothetical protein